MTIKSTPVKDSPSRRLTCTVCRGVIVVAADRVAAVKEDHTETCPARRAR